MGLIDNILTARAYEDSLVWIGHADYFMGYDLAY
jgi:hypothetical protein